MPLTLASRHVRRRPPTCYNPMRDSAQTQHYYSPTARTVVSLSTLRSALAHSSRWRVTGHYLQTPRTSHESMANRDVAIYPKRFDSS
jgi:hypothetical protein